MIRKFVSCLIFLTACRVEDPRALYTCSIVKTCGYQTSSDSWQVYADSADIVEIDTADEQICEEYLAAYVCTVTSCTHACTLDN